MKRNLIRGLVLAVVPAMALVGCPPNGGMMGGLTFLSQSYGVGNEPEGIDAGDFDGDGDADLVLITRDGISVLLNNGDGSFAPAVTYEDLLSPRFVVVRDMDGDGNLDVLVADAGFLSMPAGMTLFLGNGDGTFQTAANTGVASSPFTGTAADVNGDGLVDIVAGNVDFNFTDRIVVGLADGKGGYASTSFAPSGQGFVGIVAADLDGDGALDLATANRSTDNVSVFLGNGDGTFQAEQLLETSQFPETIVAEDLDGDGNLDLILASSVDEDATVLLGNGDGTFQAAVSYFAGSEPLWADVADIDGDGVLDIVVANGFSDDVSVLLGSGDGTFQPQVRVDAGDNAVSVVAADMDGDGDTDLATANRDSDEVTVLLKQPEEE